MKSSPPPLSPYGVFTGSLFQYSTSPSLIAFESPPLPSPISVATREATTSASDSSSSNRTFRNKLILLGGLSDGPLPCPYTSPLEQKCHDLGWSLVQPILSSSYLGFGHGSLSRDTDEIGRLMEYLVCHHDAENFALVGHSTGCQNSIHFLKHGEKEMVEKVKVCVLQAPVSDRESLTLSPGDHSAHMMHAKNLASQDKGEEMMPRDSFWAPITASRYISLFDVNGEDDFFSSDFSDEELRSRLGHVGAVGKNSGLRLLSVFSGKDEYVPSWVDKDVLLQRHLWAMNNLDDNFDKWQKGCNNENNLIAKGLVLMGANHNLSKGDGDIDQFVDAVGKLMKSAISKGVSMGH